MANSILSTVEVVMDLRSIVLRLGRYRILLECRSLYPLSSDLCILEYVITYFGQATNYVGQVQVINYLPGKES